MSNYLKKLIEIAEGSRTTIDIKASYQGLSITITAMRGGMSDPVMKQTCLWIDKNETDMNGRLDHFLKLVQRP